MKKSAFTMAEAVLVMTILGIIATIMITTLKPAEFKEKGLAVLAKKVLSEIDTATTQILLNNTQDGTTEKIYVPGSTTTTFNANQSSVNAADSGRLGALYKSYLTATRKPCTNTTDCGGCSALSNKFYLKDGACVGIAVGKPAAVNATWFPGETNSTNNQSNYGTIFFDTNGIDEPNVLGKDQFLIPLGKEGILYAQ